MQLPNYITHYYYPDKEPFLNLSALGEAERHEVIKELNERRAQGITQRGFPDWYMPQRLDSEREMLAILKKKGVVPERQYPHYFVLGNSSFFEKFYNRQYKIIRIPIEAFAPNEITFTPSDSLWCIGKVLQPDTAWKSMWFDQQLFSYSEICEILIEHEVDVSDAESLKKFRAFFVEAQVWNDRVVEEFKLTGGSE